MKVGLKFLNQFLHPTEVLEANEEPKKKLGKKKKKSKKQRKKQPKYPMD